MIIAQVPTADPSHLITFIICAVACVVVVNYVMQLWQALRPKPPYDERYALKSELRALEGKIDAFVESSRAARGKIYETLRGQCADIAALRTATESQERRLIQIESKLDRLIERKL